MQLTYVNPPTGYTRPVNEPHTEFPKFVHRPGQPSVIANTPAEEAAILSGEEAAPLAPIIVAEPPIAVPSLVGQNDEETMLRKIAAEKGIRIDGRWKLPKIRKAVEVATRDTGQ